MHRRLLMAQQAAEDYGSVLSLRRHFCREAEICPSERFCGVVVRGGGEIVFAVGSPRRLRLSRKDLVYRLDLGLGGLPLGSYRTVFRVQGTGGYAGQIAMAVRYRVELQDYRSFFLSHYRLVSLNTPLMATARFSPRDGSLCPCLLSEVGEAVARLCERAAQVYLPIGEGCADIAPLRRAIGEVAERDLDERGLYAWIDPASLTLLPPRSAMPIAEKPMILTKGQSEHEME